MTCLVCLEELADCNKGIISAHDTIVTNDVTSLDAATMVSTSLQEHSQEETAHYICSTCFKTMVQHAVRSSPPELPIMCPGRCLQNGASKPCPCFFSERMLRLHLDDDTLWAEYLAASLRHGMLPQTPQQCFFLMPCCKRPIEITRSRCPIVDRIINCPFVGCDGTMCTGCERRLTAQEVMLAEDKVMERVLLESQASSSNSTTSIDVVIQSPHIHMSNSPMIPPPPTTAAAQLEHVATFTTTLSPIPHQQTIPIAMNTDVHAFGSHIHPLSDAVVESNRNDIESNRNDVEDNHIDAQDNHTPLRPTTRSHQESSSSLLVTGQSSHGQHRRAPRAPREAPRWQMMARRPPFLSPLRPLFWGELNDNDNDSPNLSDTSDGPVSDEQEQLAEVSNLMTGVDNRLLTTTMELLSRGGAGNLGLVWTTQNNSILLAPFIQRLLFSGDGNEGAADQFDLNDLLHSRSSSLPPHDHMSDLCHRTLLHESISSEHNGNMNADYIIDVNTLSSMQLAALVRKQMELSLPRCPTCRRIGIKEGDSCNEVSCECGIKWCFVCSRRFARNGEEYLRWMSSSPDTTAFMLLDARGESPITVHTRHLSSANHHGFSTSASECFKHDALNPGKQKTLCPSTLAHYASVFQVPAFVQAASEFKSSSIRGRNDGNDTDDNDSVLQESVSDEEMTSLIPTFAATSDIDTNAAQNRHMNGATLPDIHALAPSVTFDTPSNATCLEEALIPCFLQQRLFRQLDAFRRNFADATSFQAALSLVPELIQEQSVCERYHLVVANDVPPRQFMLPSSPSSSGTDVNYHGSPFQRHFLFKTPTDSDRKRAPINEDGTHSPVKTTTNQTQALPDLSSSSSTSSLINTLKRPRHQ